MKLWLVERTDNCDQYDIWDSLVVSARTKTEARNTPPWFGDHKPPANYIVERWVSNYDDLKVTEIGTAIEGSARRVVLESYQSS